MRDDGHFEAFDAMMHQLFAYFGSTYKAERISEIYRDISEITIPAEAFPEIGKRLRRKLDSTSGNLGIRIIDAWAEAGKHYGDQVVKEPCRLCNSAGAFSAGKENRFGQLVWHTYRCAGCTNWHGVYGKTIPAAYPLVKRNEGYRIQTFLPVGHTAQKPSEQEEGGTHD